jgi:hypothetical protein
MPRIVAMTVSHDAHASTWAVTAERSISDSSSSSAWEARARIRPQSADDRPSNFILLL